MKNGVAEGVTSDPHDTSEYWIHKWNENVCLLYCQNVNVVFDCPVAGAPTPIMERDEVKESLKTSIGKVS